jgi:hypothetical protein
VLFVTELLQSLGNGQANERQPRRNRSRRSKIPPFPRRSAITHRLTQIFGTLIPLIESVGIGTKGICGENKVKVRFGEAPLRLRSGQASPAREARALPR